MTTPAPLTPANERADAHLPYAVAALVIASFILGLTIGWSVWA